jgi:hypothetical protein
VKTVIGILALAIVFGATRPAEACGSGGGGAALAWGALVVGGSVGGAVLVGANIATITGGSLAISRHRESRAWAVGNLVVGTVDTVGSSLYLGMSGHNDIQLGVTVPFLALGAVNFGLGIANLAAPNRRSALERADLRLVPVSGLDSTGHQMGGVSLRFKL